VVYSAGLGSAAAQTNVANRSKKATAIFFMEFLVSVCGDRPGTQ
jgi:hypothetical protein